MSELTAILTVEVDRPRETAADVSFLFEALDGLIVPALWAEIALARRDDDGPLPEARAALLRSQFSDDARNRFFPGFRASRSPSFGMPQITVPDDFEASLALDYGVQVGINAWVRRVLRDEVPDAYRRLTGFVEYQRIRHESPLLIEAGIAMCTAGGVLIRAIRTTNELRSGRAAAQKAEAEARIAQAQADEAQEREAATTREQVAKAEQAETAARLQQAFADAMLQDASPERLRRAVVEQTAKAMAPAVETLVNAPLSRLQLDAPEGRPKDA